MSLIHDALEKAKLERNNRRPIKREEGFSQKKKTRKPLLILGILTFFCALALVLNFVLQKNLFTAVLRERHNMVNVVFDSAGKANDSSFIRQDTVVPLNFSSEYKKFMASGDMNKVVNLLLQYPDSADLDIVKDVLRKLMEIDDFDKVEKVVGVFDEKGLIVSPLLSNLGEYYEKKKNVKAASFYLREYISGNSNPLLLAKAATLFDLTGFTDSALKYYGLFLERADSSELYYQVKRRYIYLAERRKEDVKVR